MTNRQVLRWIPVVTALLVLVGMLAWQWRTSGDLAGVPLDDAYIHFRFAHNLATGHGFAFNPDEPTPGSTSPLWVVLLAAGDLAGLGPLITAKLLGAAALIACAWLTTRCTERLLASNGQERDIVSSTYLPVMAGVLVALAGRMAWAALSGMETLAFAALMLLALLRWLPRTLRMRCRLPGPSGRKARQTARPYIKLECALGSGIDTVGAVILGLAALLRPEGYLLFGLALALWVLEGFSQPEPVKRMARGMMYGLIFTLIISPYLAFSYFTTGSLLPNTFRANAHELTTLNYAARYIVYTAQDNWLVLVLAAWGAFHAWKRPGSRLVLAWGVGFPVVAALITPNLRHHGRYSIPFIPLTILLAALGMHAAWVKLKSGAASRELRNDRGAACLAPAQGHLHKIRDITKFGHSPRAWQSVAAGAAVLVIVMGLWNARDWGLTYAADARDMTRMQVTMARWVAANTSPGSTLALSDIGAIGYISDRRVLDIVGLVTPDILPEVSGKPVGLERDQAVFNYLVRRRPDYVVIIPTWYPYLASSPGARLSDLHTVTLDHIPSVGGGDHLRAYQTDWGWFDAEGAPGNRLEARLGDAIAMDGFDLEPGQQAQAGGTLDVTLHWRSAKPAGRFKVFVQLLDEGNQVIAQNDSEPAGDLWPTSLWQPGDTIRDKHTLHLPPGQAGRWQMVAGMYDGRTGTRLPIPNWPGDAIVLTTIEVTR